LITHNNFASQRIGIRASAHQLDSVSQELNVLALARASHDRTINLDSAAKSQTSAQLRLGANNLEVLLTGAIRKTDEEQ